MRFLALSALIGFGGALLLGGCAQKEQAATGEVHKCQVGLFSPMKETPDKRKPANGSVKCVDDLGALQN